MAKWETKTLRDTMLDIRDGKMVLPVIQRGLVWDEDKMTALFDSLLKEYAFGSIMVIKEEKGDKSLFASRPFSLTGEIHTSSNEGEKLDATRFFVIDGQQRLQSFYIGLLGTFENKTLYFNVTSDVNDFDFRFKKELTDLPKNSDNIYECVWYSVKSIFAKLKDQKTVEDILDDICSERNIQEDNVKKIIRRNITSFERIIFTHLGVGIAVVQPMKTTDTEKKQHIVELSYALMTAEQNYLALI